MDMGYIEALVKKRPINRPIDFPPVNTPVCLDFPSETVSAWFSCLKHIYYTRNVGKNCFFNEIQNAVSMKYVMLNPE